MPIPLATITLMILILCFLFQIQSYKIKIILHPSFWFFVIWILSVTSFLVYVVTGLDYIVIDKDMLDELFAYISFTAICITIIGYLNKNIIEDRLVVWTPILNINTYVFISTSLFVVAILNFFVFSGFDLALNRSQLIQFNEMISSQGESIPFSAKLYNFMMALNTPLLVLSGYYIGCELNKSDTYKKSLKKEYIYPFLVALISTIKMGGRSGIVSAAIMLVSGFALAIFSSKQIKKKLIGRIARYALMFFIVFSIFSTYVNIIREGSRYQQSSSYYRWEKYPILIPLSGLLQYLTDHYPGYQLRRFDSVTPELEMGQISLSGFTMFTVPVVSQIVGTPLSIQSIFDLALPNTIEKSVKLESSGALWSHTTGTVYLLLYDDFGFYGVFIVILLFVLYSQYLFNSLFKVKRKYSTSVLPFILVYYLWSQSIFSHHIIGNWISGYLYAFLLLDLISIVSNRLFGRQ